MLKRETNQRFYSRFKIINIDFWFVIFTGQMRYIIILCIYFFIFLAVTFYLILYIHIVKPVVLFFVANILNKY